MVMAKGTGIFALCLCAVLLCTAVGQLLDDTGSGAPQQSNGFLGLDAVRQNAFQIYDVENINNENEVQGIFLDMRFSCNATITKLIFIARTIPDQGIAIPPEFQVWRANGSTLYSKVSSVEADNSICEGVVCELTPNQTLRGEPGDVFGIYQPSARLSMILVYYQTGGGTTGFVQNTDALDSLNTASGGEVSYYPLVAVETSSPECVEGFLDEEAVAMYGIGFDRWLRSHPGEQRLIPGLRFMCNGSLSKWIMGARIRSTVNMTYPELQIWRRQGQTSTSPYIKVANNTITELNSTGDLNVYEFVVDPPLQFEMGDAIGIHQPPDEYSQVVLYYNQRNEFQSMEDGPLNYRIKTPEPWNTGFFLSLGLVQDRDVPILRVETDPQNCTSENIITNEELIARAAEIVALTRHHDQQRIIPGINFTDDGLLVTWTFTASYNPDGTMFPELQIWREINLTYTMVHSTDSSMEPNTTGYLNVYQYVLDIPIPVQADDVLGVYQPPDEMSRLSLMFHEGNGPPNFITPQGVQAQVAGDPVDNDFPLVTVETSMSIMPEASTVVPSTPVVPSTSVEPTPTQDVTEPTSSSEDDSSNRNRVIIGATLGCVFAIILVVIVIIVIVICVMRRKKRVSGTPLHQTSPHPGETSPHPVETSRHPGETPLQPGETSPGVSQATEKIAPLDNPIYDGGTQQEDISTTEAPDIGTSLSDAPPPPASDDPPVSGDKEPLNESQPLLDSGFSQDDTIQEAVPANGGVQLGFVVPTEEERKNLKGDDVDHIYATLCERQCSKCVSNPTFFEESEVYWRPAAKEAELYQQLSLKKYREIVRTQIRITDEELGHGQFGMVKKGVWHAPEGVVDVAVKMLKEDGDRVKFLREAAINGQFKHPNVVRILGVATVGNPVMIILEYLGNGDLRSYLIQQRPWVPGEMVPLGTNHMLLGFCKDIASGMEYLASKSFVHRDLAARNILVSTDKVCKISDFGVSRDLQNEDYYVSHGGKIPVKWTAPESLHFKKYSTASDVWSFGMVMYEIWSLGHKPLEGYTNQQAVKRINSGRRLIPPPGCPKEIYRFMMSCWNPDPSARPTFTALLQSLSQPEPQVLSWSEEDVRVHSQAAVLGGEMEAGNDLYPGLQKRFVR